MAQFLVGTIHGASGPVQDGPEVRNAVMATTMVESLRDSSNQKWEIAGMLSQYDNAQDCQQIAETSMVRYIVYAQKEKSGLCYGSPCVICAQPRFVHYVSIPNNVLELCDHCFQSCDSLRRVTFSSLSTVERIGVYCFKDSGVEEVIIPDSVRELCDGCFSWCKSLRRVTFGPSSSLERIGVSCFEESGVEEVSVPDGVRELCDGCFNGCSSLRRVTFDRCFVF